MKRVNNSVVNIQDRTSISEGKYNWPQNMQRYLTSLVITEMAKVRSQTIPSVEKI